MSHYEDGPKKVYKGDNVVIVSVESHLVEDDINDTINESFPKDKEEVILDFIKFLGDNGYQIINKETWLSPYEADPIYLIDEYKKRDKR